MAKKYTWLAWLDDNILVLLAGFLLAFIPLYPKIPLVDIIPGYLVRLRVEDLFIAFTFAVWLVQILRKKVQLATPLFIPILVYAAIGLLSTLSAVVISQTVPAELLHVGKSLLHYFRYLEYFSLYFILASAIKHKKQVGYLMGIIVVTVLALAVYGYGQKYLFWPVYSTMNREFAKGMRLVLTEHARVQSTFGGHYDLGGYLALVLPLLAAVKYATKKWWQRVFINLSYLSGLWLMVMTAARTAYLAYIVANVGVVLYYAYRNHSTWTKRIADAIVTFTGLLIINAVLLIAFGDNMYARLVQTLDSYPSIAAPYHELEIQAVDVYNEINDGRQRLGDAVFKGEWSRIGLRPENAVDYVPPTPSPIINADSQPVPSDVYVIVPDYVQVATTSADGSVVITTQERERTYSANALKYGLSLGIRLDTLWPNALRGWFANPFLGSGYATLTKESVGQFTEAESTDNNFLRTLGETGALGFVSFYGIIGLASYLAIVLLRRPSVDSITRSYAVGFLAVTVAMLINAMYIDTFAASKIAFAYWSFTGILVALYVLTIQEKNDKPSVKPARKK